jgi:hypothetical protein
MGKKQDAEDDFDKELGQVMREEQRRGRRPLDEDMLALKRQFERDFLSLLREGDERKFRAFLNAHGLHTGEERFQNAMRQWRAYQKQHQKP